MACNCVGLWHFRDAQLAQLASFPSLVRSRLDPVGRASWPPLPAEAERRCTWRRGTATSRWSRCCWGPAPPWRWWMTNTVADPRAVAATGTVSGRRANAFYLPSTFVQVDPFPVSAWNDASGIGISDKYDSISCCLSCEFFWWKCQSRFAGSNLLLSEYHLCPHSNDIAQWRMIDQSVWIRDKGLKMWY